MFVFLDPFETQNRVSSLTPEEKAHLHDTLQKLVACKGRNCQLPRSNGFLGEANTHTSVRNSRRKLNYPGELLS